MTLRERLAAMQSGGSSAYTQPMVTVYINSQRITFSLQKKPILSQLQYYQNDSWVYMGMKGGGRTGEMEGYLGVVNTCDGR